MDKETLKRIGIAVFNAICVITLTAQILAEPLAVTAALMAYHILSKIMQ